jgi:hypothetical protein
MRLLLATMLLASITLTADAQTLWRGRSTASSVGLSFQRPKFSERNTEYSGLVFALAGEFALSPSTLLMVELPFMTASISSAFYSNDETAVGNPYLGVQFGSRESEFFGEFGVRLPFMEDGNGLAGSIGVLADIEHFEAYVPHILQISASANAETEIAPTLWLLAKAGPDADIFTKGGGDGNLYLNYGATMQLRLEEFRAGFGYAARTLLNRSEFSDRTVDHVAIGGSYRFTHVELGLQARYSMDEYIRREIDFAYGLSVRVIP